MRKSSEISRQSNNKRKIIPLSVIVDAIEETTDGWRQFYNVVTGEVESIPSWDNGYVEMDDFQETAEKIDESDDYVELPTQRELHEYDIMERFAESQDSEALFRALNGRKPFRTFKDRAIQLGLEQEYYAFRSAAYVGIAREWCWENDVPFTENGISTNSSTIMKPDRDDLAWKEVETEHIIQNEWIDFRQSAYQLPNGAVFEPFYSYSRRNYVVIVASDTEGNYICVRQFRQGIRQVTTEFPAGGLERSDGKEYGARTNGSASEGALDAAKRELLEETGYVSDEWTHLLTIPSSATIADNYAFVYMAKNCRKVAEPHLDITEFLHVEMHTADEIENLIYTEKFQQSVHVMAWLLAKEKSGIGA